MKFFVLIISLILFNLKNVTSCGQNTDPPYANYPCTCKWGFYANSQEDIENTNIGCKQCPSHSTNFGNHAQNFGLEQCNRCEMGYYIEQQASTGAPAKCIPCPQGTYNSVDINIDMPPIVGIATCSVCKIGYYNSSKEKTSHAECNKCPGNTSTRLINELVLLKDCDICDKGYYIYVSAQKDEAAQCLPCPKYSSAYFSIYKENTQVQIQTPPCVCDDIYASLLVPTNEDMQCVCMPGFRGTATPEYPCIDIQLNSSNTSLKIFAISAFNIFFLIIFL